MLSQHWFNVVLGFACLCGCAATATAPVNDGVAQSGETAFEDAGTSAPEPSAAVASSSAGVSGARVLSAGRAGTTRQNVDAGLPSGNAGAAGAIAGSVARNMPALAGASGVVASPSAAGSGGVMATSPAVRSVGRSAAGALDSLRFSWSGVNMQARFMGTQVSMDVIDGSNKNRFTVVLDGGMPRTVTTTPGQNALALATGLANGIHDILIWRNTEAAMGVSEFAGLSDFGAGGALLAPAAAPERRIEVIGDSLSAGAGVEGTSTTCNPNIDAFTNSYLAYGSVAARSVAADIVTIAWSGIGVYRSYNANDPTMPARYDFAIPNDQSAWDFEKYQPHVVVINLGTNDFGSGNPGQPYVDAYVSFIQHIRTKYAQANMILIDMYGGDRATAIASVIEALKRSGESKVELLSFSSVPNNNTACNQHPNVAAHNAMGELLAARLESLMNW